MYKRLKQNIESNALVNDEFVYFWHKYEGIRHEVRKRSSYLGSKRVSKDGNNLLDQIAMTDDEKDLFTSLFLDATANAYDVLSGLMKADTSSYFISRGTPIDISIPSGEMGVSIRSFSYSNNNITAFFESTDTIDDNVSRYVGDVRIKYNVRYSPHGTNSYKTETRYEDATVVLVRVQNTNRYLGSIPFVPKLEGATSIFSAEQFDRIVSIDPIAFFCELKTPVVVNEGDIVTNEGKYYRALEESYISRAEDVEVLETLPGDITESVVYRLAMADEFDTNAVPAIDISLYNMLVNYILWKWLMIASPDDAQSYFVLYNQDKETLGSRINRSRIGATEITPRMY